MITLLTDFGTRDYFVPAVKGVLLSLHPSVQIIDLTHDIPAQDIWAAAFTLGACYRQFPAGTVHLAVVDPGVGSARRCLVVEAGGQFFVGPDNGIFSFVYAQEAHVRIFHVTRADFFRSPVSPTFHGRDVFAPLAAWLAKGVAPDGFGVEIQNAVRLPLTSPRLVGNHLEGEVLHIDRFGNCITNLTGQDFRWEDISATTRLLVAGREVQTFGTHFAQTENEQDLLAYLGSAGYWEVALWQDSAAQKLGIERGGVVQLWR